MKTIRVALCALVCSAAGASSQSATPSGPPRPLPGAACAVVPPQPRPPECPPTTGNLTPMASSTRHSTGTNRLYSGSAWPAEWLHREAMARDAEDQQDARDTLTRQYLDQVGIRAAMARARAGTIAARSATFAPGRPPGDAARLEIIEWRRSALEAAESAHHAILERITASFDSAQQPRVSQRERLNILTKLDRINQANESTWIAITNEINRMADSVTVTNRGVP